MSSTLLALIGGACSSTRFEPDLGLNLEICEMINNKQGSAPREAANSIVRYINSRNLNQAMLALTLLDNCVKNCGYPFYLQIASKEFLNELVRQFPERPAPFPSPVTQRILYLIKEWKVALSDMSKYKDDLVHIKDMYRLLKYKGYRFPELRDASIAALAPSESLKSAHELEEEDRMAQSAKLQELIRRGRPEDLVEANKLMKVMSGFDTKQAPDYSQKFEDELTKVQDRAILLYEMLENIKQGENIEHDDTIMDLRNACGSAQPKIQKMITEEEDHEKIEQLLVLNDMLNNVVAKFNDVKKGLFDTQYEMSGKQPTQTVNNPEPRQAISLIDLDDDPPTTTTNSNNINELNDLFGTASISAPQAQPAQSRNDIFDLLGQPTTTSPSHSIPSPSLQNTGTLQQKQQSPASSSPTVSSTTNANIKTIELVNKNGLKITLEVNKNDTVYHVKAYFSNQSTAPMEGLMLKLAVPKSMQLKMEPQSSQLLPPKSDKSVHQNIVLKNSKKEALRLRYKVNYEQFGVGMELTGDYRS